MERFLTKLLPGIDFIEQLENEKEVQPLRQRVETLPRNDDIDNVTGIMSNFKLNPEHNRFFGKSSVVQLVQTGLNFQGRFSGVPEIPGPMIPQKRPQFWMQWEGGREEITETFGFLTRWMLPASTGSPQCTYVYPDPDLLTSLVDLYFKEVNAYWPLLHRPTFERKLANNLHLYNHKFGATVLLVCSLGARHSDDRRIYLEGAHIHTAGWKWGRQVRVVPEHLMGRCDLYELQTMALSTIYFFAISPTTLAWNYVGLALRRAQDVGAHRRRTGAPTAEGEEWKRVFWVLLCIDWIFGATSGRPLAIHVEDFDQDLPIDCDDEYWDPGFTQPKDKPSSMSYFICFVKLLEIQSTIVTNLYSPRRPKNIHGQLSPPTDAECIMAFDSTLNSWLGQLPEHLRWDPDRRNRLHLTQSGVLQAVFSETQILVHRPYIPPFQRASDGIHRSQSATVPSLALCTNAARSCIHVLETHIRRGIPPNFTMLPPVFSAAVIILLNAWINGNPNFANTPSKELDQVYTCLRFLEEAEKRYLAAGRYTDLINRLLYNGESLDSLLALGLLSEEPPSAQLDFGLAEWSQRDPYTYGIGEFNGNAHNLHRAFPDSNSHDLGRVDAPFPTRPANPYTAVWPMSHVDNWSYMRQNHPQ
ncbi:fungal-specific transcription factor domain-containing protein [Mycena metata]|uniref:Fungal-specific transcription factor domain-containing protein n=1 Tax=Mycena metata TaxID=1033252 RepID=A0AAD7IRF7_9AGAR|nr:fungal-specific transcription factor domain-containing protein [Mycena metata]